MTDPIYGDVAVVLDVLDARTPQNVVTIAERLGWRQDLPRVTAALEQAIADGVVEEVGVGRWRLVRGETSALTVLTVRGAESRQGYVDGFAGVIDTARSWAAGGRSFDDFIAWATDILPLLEETETARPGPGGLRHDLAFRRALELGTVLELVPSDDDPDKREDTDVAPIAFILRAGAVTVQDYVDPGVAQELGTAFLAIGRVQSRLDHEARIRAAHDRVYTQESKP